MKIYTRTGDEGATALFGGGRVEKDHPRVEAYGDGFVSSFVRIAVKNASATFA